MLDSTPDIHFDKQSSFSAMIFEANFFESPTFNNVISIGKIGKNLVLI